VTIFGQSAGGLSVHTQLASPLAAGLFQRAIAQSGAYSLSQPSLASAEAQGTDLAATLGCTDETAACLRSLPVSTLLAHPISSIGTLIPNVDGFVLPRSIGATLASGQFNRVPVIEGSTHDEFSIFYKLQVEDVFGILPPFFYPIAVNTLVQTLGVGKTAAQILAEYPLANYGQNVARAVTAIGTDFIFACSGRRAAGTLSGFVPTYAYEFDDPNVPQVFVPPASIPYGSYHASDLVLLFDSFNRGGSAPLTPDEQSLAAAMVKYWTQFAATGSPNGSGAPPWTNYTTANDTYQSLHPPTPGPTTNFAADHHCAFWDS
jgi:para-nitrobenzyl esterase